MSGFLGADTDALRALARLYETSASALESSAVATLENAPAVTWVGTDAEEFRSSSHQLRARLESIQAMIRRWADDFEAEAEQQDDTSADGSAVPGSGNSEADPGNSPIDLFKDFPFSSGNGDSWSLPDIFPRISPHEWAPPLLKEGADAVADQVEKGLPVAERVLKKGTPIIPDMYDAGRHYLNGETAEGNFAVMRGLVSAVPYVGAGVDIADLATSADPDGSILERAEERYVTGMNDPDSAMSKGEQIGLDKADELGIENEYARNIVKSVMGNGYAWEQNNLHRDENGDINPWMT